MINLGIPFQLVNPSAGGGGGGGGTPTIAADMTINVPTDQASINDALNYVRARVVLNGAIITINVESALLPTINEQILFENEDMRCVRITNDGPVNIDSTGFVAYITAFPIPVWYLAIMSSVGEVTGTWVQSAGGPCAGFVSLQSVTATGIYNAADTFDISGFFYTLIVFSGEHRGHNSTITGSLLVSDGTVSFNGSGSLACYINLSGLTNFYVGGTLTIDSTDTQGVLIVSDGAVASINADVSWTVNNPAIAHPFKAENGGKIIFANTLTMTFDVTGSWASGNIGVATNGSFIQFGSATFVFPNLEPANGLFTAQDSTITVIGCSSSVIGYVFSNVRSLNCISGGNTWNANGSATLYLSTGGGNLSVSDTINIGAGNPALAGCDNGTMTFNTLNITGVSTGLRYTVNGGGVIQSNGVGLLEFTGGDSQVAVVPTAVGLILA